MAVHELNMQRLLLRGFIAEHGIEDKVEYYNSKIMGLLEEARAKGDEELSAFVMAVSLISIDLAEGSE